MKLIDVLQKMKVGDLKKEISKQNIKGYSKLRKAEIIKLMIDRKDRFKYLLLQNMNQKKELLQDKVKLKEAKEKLQKLTAKKIPAKKAQQAEVIKPKPKKQPLIPKIIKTKSGIITVKPKEEKEKAPKLTVKKEVIKPQGPTPQRAPKSKPTKKNDEFNFNKEYKRYLILVKNIIDKPNKKNLEMIDKYEQQLSEENYTFLDNKLFDNEPKLRERFQKSLSVAIQDKEDKDQAKKDRERKKKEKEELKQLELEAEKEEPKKETPKPAPKKEAKELSKDEKQLQQLFINDARLKNKLKGTKSPMISGLSPKEREIRTKIRIGIEKEIKENKFLLFELEEKMKFKKEVDDIKKEKAKLKLFKLNVDKFLKKPTEALLEFIDINIELIDELPESKQDKLDKAIDKFEKKKK